MAGQTGTNMGITPAERSRLQLESIRVKWVHLEPDQREAVLAVVSNIHALGPRACRILALQSERLNAGSSYGDFEKGRKWGKDAFEELIDLAHYISAALLELKEDE